MDVLAEAFIAAFDSNAELTWSAGDAGEVVARFDVSGTRVNARFTEVARSHWQVGFDVTSRATATENIESSSRVFSGVFEAAHEFLEVRQPERLTFASKEAALGRLYEQYLQKQDAQLRQIGYRMVSPVKASPFAEFALEKTTPSEWREFGR